MAGSETRCPRCGGEYQTLRRSSRWGRIVVVLMCHDCQYLTQPASTRQRRRTQFMLKLTLLFLITSSALVVAVTLLVGVAWLAIAIPVLLVTGAGYGRARRGREGYARALVDAHRRRSGAPRLEAAVELEKAPVPPG